MIKLSQSEIIQEIEKIGDTESVNFDNKSLSSVNLGYDVVRQLVNKQKNKRPAWYSGSTHGINFRGTGFRKGEIKKSVFTQADFSAASLNDAVLKGTNFTDSKFIDSFLVGTNASEAKFNYCDMRGCYLLNSNLSRADFSHAKLQEADLSNTNLHRALFINAKLSNVDFSNANMDEIDLSGAWLNGTLLSRL